MKIQSDKPSQTSQTWKLLSLLLALSLVLTALPLTACTSAAAGAYKIAVIREDDSSGEAKAWEEYLRTVGGELNFTFDFTTTDSSAAEVSAINTYASKGYDAVLLLSDDDIPAAVRAAAAKKMYVCCPVGRPTDAQYETLAAEPYYLGSVAPSYDAEYRAGYDMARFFVEEKGQTAFTVFGGATAYGAQMHTERLAGILAYLCESPDTAYDGVTDRDSIKAKITGTGVDPRKLSGSTYRITGYMDGFSFDDAFTTKLTAGMEAGGTCLLSVGAGDVVTKIAYGITQSNRNIPSFTSGGVDAITQDYADCFDLGYTYDCGKYASAMAPGLILTLAALNGSRITAADGLAPRIGMSYWTATDKRQLETMLASDSPAGGYCYDAAVVRSYAARPLADLVRLCQSDYEAARSVRDLVHAQTAADGTAGTGEGTGA